MLTGFEGLVHRFPQVSTGLRVGLIVDNLKHWAVVWRSAVGLGVVLSILLSGAGVASRVSGQ